MTSPQSSIMVRLRESTREVHQWFEKLDYFANVFEGKMPKEAYIQQLKALAIIFCVLEKQHQDTPDPRLARISLSRRFQWIEKDLEALNANKVPDNLLVLGPALEVADHIIRRHKEKPFSLLGYFYVIEGSKLGGVVLAPHFQKCFHLAEEGLAFLSNGGQEAHSEWRQFSNSVDQQLWTDDEEKEILEAARECFEGLHRIYYQLGSSQISEKVIHVTSINPEAGNHPIPYDPREIEAAIEAADLCWKEFPYYERRYGDRGRRFARSDSAWLASLITLSPESVQREVGWLNRVLVARGMPSLTMVRHLQLLAQCLRKIPSSKEENVAKLEQAAEKLEQQGLGIFSAEQRKLWAENFKARTKGIPDFQPLDNAADLVIGAVADQINGHREALPSLKKWLCDPEIWPASWVEAVEELEASAALKD